MARRTAKYDGDLQMFVQEPRDPNMARLGFLRWLMEHRSWRMEHPIAGPPSGPLSDDQPPADGAAAA